MLKHDICGIAVGCIVVSAMLGTVSSEAEACQWVSGVLEATLPEDGAEVSPDVEFSVWFKPGGPDLSFHLADGDGVEFDVEVRHRQFGREAGLVDHYRIVPNDLLPPGDYVLSASRSDVTLAVEVVEKRAESAPTIEAFDWTRDNDVPLALSDCFGGIQQWIELEVDTDRDDAWFDISYDTGAFGTEPASNPLRHYLTEVPDCVTVEAVGVDGRRSKPVKRCVGDQKSTELAGDDEPDSVDDGLPEACEESSTSTRAPGGGGRACPRVGYAYTYSAERDVCVMSTHNQVCNFTTPFESMAECLQTCTGDPPRERRDDLDRLPECPDRYARMKSVRDSNRIVCDREICIRDKEVQIHERICWKEPPRRCWFPTPYDFDWIIELD